MSTLPPNERETRLAGEVNRPAAGSLTGERLAQEDRETKRSMKVVTGGASTEAVLGAAAVVLAILGLAEVQTFYMLTIATIAIGAALFVEGASIMGRYSALVRETGGGAISRTELGGGMSTEVAAGAAGVVLGILALIEIEPVTLCAIAVIVFGAALLLTSGATNRLAELEMVSRVRHDYLQEATRQATQAAAGTQTLVGLAAIVLGILALIQVEPLTLTLVGLLSIGAALLFSGGAVASRMGSLLHS